MRSTQEKNESNINIVSPPEQKKNNIYTHMVDLQETVYIAQTGKFPHLSSKGNRYIVTGTRIDSNYIFLEPTKTRNNKNLVGVY